MEGNRHEGEVIADGGFVQRLWGVSRALVVICAERQTAGGSPFRFTAWHGNTLDLKLGTGNESVFGMYLYEQWNTLDLAVAGAWDKQRIKDKTMKMSLSNIRYFTRSMLIQASQLGLKWDFNRQISETIAEVPDLRYPVTLSISHHHRHGLRCESHIRCLLSLYPFTDCNLICDVPTDFFEKLPTIRMKRSVLSILADLK